MNLKRQWVSLDDLVTSALTRVKLAGHAVTVDLPDTISLLSVDGALLEQVFVNLLENASKHTPPETPIEIAGRILGDAWEIDVADRGPGIDVSLREKVFEKFYRGPTAGARGAGLGLAICRGIVEAHGGSLVLEERAGGGAIFRIVLPTALNSPPLPEDDNGGEVPEGAA